MTSVNCDHLIKQIKTFICFDHLIIEDITVITEGLSHACFKVSIKDVSDNYFVKYFNKDFESFQKELTLAAVFSNKTPQDESLRLTPQVIANYPSCNCIVYQFIAGQSLSQSSLAEDDKTSICISLMTQVHRFSANLPVLNIKEVITDLIKQLKQANDFNEKHHQIITDFCQQFLHDLTVKNHYLCHGDMNFSNVIITSNEHLNKNNGRVNYNVNEQNTRLIDFECACLADREFDIAMMIAINNLPFEQAELLTKKYSEFTGNSTVLDDDLVMRYLVFSHLINGLWFIGQKYSLLGTTGQSLAEQQFLALNKLTGFDFSYILTSHN